MVSYSRILAMLQYLSLSIGVLFVGYLAYEVKLRSGLRSSLIEVELAGSTHAEPASEVPKGGVLKIRDFYRIEVKHGRTHWEIRARNAEHQEMGQLTLVREAKVKVFREDSSSVDIFSDSAKLYMHQGTLARAELEGNVKVKFENGAQISAPQAVYYGQTEKIEASGGVEIQDQGYLVRGDLMEVGIEEEVITLTDNVYSEFKKSEGTNVPFTF